MCGYGCGIVWDVGGEVCGMWGGVCGGGACVYVSAWLTFVLTLGPLQVLQT